MLEIEFRKSSVRHSDSGSKELHYSCPYKNNGQEAQTNTSLWEANCTHLDSSHLIPAVHQWRGQMMPQCNLPEASPLVPLLWLTQETQAVIFSQLKLGQDESGHSMERKQVWCGGTVSPWQSRLSQACLRLPARHALGQWPTAPVPLQLTVWQGAHHTLNSEAWVHDDPPKYDPELPGTAALPDSAEAALQSYTQGLEGFAAGVVTHPNTTRTHTHISMVLWEFCIPTPWLGHGLALGRSCR